MLDHTPAVLSRYILTSHGVKSILTNIREATHANRRGERGNFCPHCGTVTCERDYVGQTEYIHEGMLFRSHVHVCDVCQRFYHLPVSAKKYGAFING